MFLVRLSAVCRHWRFAAIGDGTLWRNISFSPSILPTVSCAVNFLRRSRGAPLALAIWNTDCSDAVVQDPILADLMCTLGKSSDRITALHVVNPPGAVIQAFNRPAANLGRLSIHANDCREIPPLFGGSTPQLEHLSISNPAGWDVKTFQHLHTLHITGNRRKRWRLGTLLDCLDTNVTLKELHLTHFELFEPEPTTSTKRVVSLSSLQLLRITFCDSALLLDRLDVPPSVTLSVYNYCRPSEDILTLLPKSPRFLETLKRPRFLTVVFDVEKQIFEVEILESGQGVHLLLGAVPRNGQFERKWVLRSMTAVARFTPLSGVKWLTMVVDEYKMPWKMWLSRFDQISTLEVRCPDPGEILDALAASTANTGQALCPLLRSLSMERSKRPTVDSSILREFLVTRASTGNAIWRLNLHDLDWSSVASADLVAWEELIRRTQLDGECRCVSTAFFFFHRPRS